jgi:hypothetical protein
VVGPFGRPLRDERHVWLGGRARIADHDFYLFANEEVWCLATSDSMYRPGWWWRLLPGDRRRRLDGGMTVGQLAEKRKYELGP